MSFVKQHAITVIMVKFSSKKKKSIKIYNKHHLKIMILKVYLALL